MNSSLYARRRLYAYAYEDATKCILYTISYAYAYSRALKAISTSLLKKYQLSYRLLTMIVYIDSVPLV